MVSYFITAILLSTNSAFTVAARPPSFLAVTSKTKQVISDDADSSPLQLSGHSHHAAAAAVSKVPRGGGTVEPELLGKIVIGSVAIMSAFGFPNPEWLSETFSGQGFAPGSIDELIWTFTGSDYLSVALMSYLNTFTDASPSKVAIMGTLPCGYNAWKLLLTNTCQKAGLKKGAGLTMVLSFVPSIMLALGKGDSDIIIKYFAAVCLSSGLLSMFGSPGLMKDLYGVSLSGPSISNNKWLGRWNFLCGFLFLGLTDLIDLSPIQMDAGVAFLLAAYVLDHAYIQKDSAYLPNQDKSIMIPWILLYTALGFGMLALGGGEVPIGE